MEQWRWYGDHSHRHLISHLSSKLDKNTSIQEVCKSSLMFSDVFLSAINDFIETTCHRLYPFQATNALQRNLPHHIRSRFCPLVKPINFIFFRDLQLMWWNFFSCFFQRRFITNNFAENLGRSLQEVSSQRSPCWHRWAERSSPHHTSPIHGGKKHGNPRIHVQREGAA